MMDRPIRWREPGSDATGQVRELLAQAPVPKPITGADLLRSAARLPVGPPPPPAGPLGTWAGVVKGLAVITMSVAVAYTGVVAVSPRDRPVRRTAPAAVVPARPAVVSPTLLEPVIPPAAVDTPSPSQAAGSYELGPARPARAARGGNSHVAPAPGGDSADALARESQLLRDAHAVIQTRPALTLARLRQHEAQFPNGQLAAERELLAMDALRRLGRGREARVRGQTYVARYPHGLHTERVRRMLDTLP